MLERFTKDARAVVVAAAETEAAAWASPSIEAEHLLLALARRGDTDAGRLLAARGLDHDGVLAALAAERARSLAAVGISLDDATLPPAGAPGSAGRERHVLKGARRRFGASAKRALERAAKTAVARRDRRIVAEHLLLGVLRAPVGTVPRALAAADVDAVELASAVEAALDAPEARAA